MDSTKRIVLTFPREQVNKPIVYRLIKDFDLVFNILDADITPEEEGLMTLEVSGKQDLINKGLAFLKENSVSVKPLKTEIRWEENRCTHCGACVTICPAGAITIDRATMKVSFDKEKCISCELCVKPCPVRAFEVIL